MYDQLRKNMGEVFHDLARQKESKIVEGHLHIDHVHMMISMPPKYSVAQVLDKKKKARRATGIDKIGDPNGGQSFF